MSQEKKNSIPLLLVLCVLPLITRLYLYTADMEAYSWYGLNYDMTDFFSYWKSVIFIWLAVWMLGILLWEMLQGRLKIQKGKTLYLCSGIVGGIGLSTALAADRNLAMWGGYQRFEGAAVLTGYIVLCAYAYWYSRQAQNIQMLFAGLAVISVGLCVIGLLQIAGNDPLFWESVQNMILPDAVKDVVLESRLKKNTVYLTLANSNYASMYLAGMIPLVFVFGKVNRGVRKILLYGLCILIMVCMLFTYARVGILMLAMELVCGAWLCRKVLKKYWKQELVCLVTLVTLFVAMDGMAGFRFCKRLMLTAQSFVQQRRNCELDELCTAKDGIYFSIHGKSIRLDAERGIEADDGVKIHLDQADITDDYDPYTGEISYPGMEDIRVFVMDVDEEPMLVLSVAETVFRFAHDPEEGYLLYIGNGKYDTVQSVESFGIKGTEHMASGRGYIWSRTIPLLKRYGLFGCGADHFFLVYPQNDYLGKAQYCPSPLAIVEKPHNSYLLLAVQNGLPVLIMFLAVYVTYFRNAWRCYSGRSMYEEKEWLGIGILLFSIAYMVGYMFNDSSVNISPVFFLFWGVGIRLVQAHGMIVKN